MNNAGHTYPLESGRDFEPELGLLVVAQAEACAYKHIENDYDSYDAGYGAARPSAVMPSETWGLGGFK
jgi:hypothetical protein